ncbi:MAG: hypothetical protein ACKOZW_04465 [Cyanobium sp.]
MAEFADMGDVTERYAAIETAYCEVRWPIVIDQGGRLLSQLGPEDGGLRQRLQLLMAHSYLYGFGERDAAEDLYRAVLESKAEASLRQIAAQGLEQCDLPPQPAGSAAVAAWNPDPTAMAPSQAPLKPEDLPQPASAPSLDDDGGPSLHDSVQALIPSVPPESSAPRASAPVMPWLESALPARATPVQEVATGLATPAESAAMPGGTPGAAANLPWEQSPQAGDQDPGLQAPEKIEAELIDEPEMVEVHQADPRLAEEIELQEVSNLGGATAPLEGAAPPGEPGDAAGLEAPTRTPSLAEPVASAATLPELEDDGWADDAELRQSLLRVEIL